MAQPPSAVRLPGLSHFWRQPTKPTILKFDPSREFFTREGCFILELANSTGDPQGSIARARVLTGATTRWHRVRGTVERYVILEGKGRAEVGDLPPQDVGPGDVVIIPAGFRQRITNLGREDLVFLCICTPRFVQEAYEDLE